MTARGTRMPEGRSLLSAIHRHALEQPDRRALVFLDADGQEERVANEPHDRAGELLILERRRPPGALQRQIVGIERGR